MTIPDYIQTFYRLSLKVCAVFWLIYFILPSRYVCRRPITLSHVTGATWCEPLDQWHHRNHAYEVEANNRLHPPIGFDQVLRNNVLPAER